VTTDLRCPECGSLVRPGAGWCTLCHADLRSEEEKAAAKAMAGSPSWEDDTTVGSDRTADGRTADAAGGEATDWAAELAALNEPALAGPVPAPAPSRGRHARPASERPVINPQAHRPALASRQQPDPEPELSAADAALAEAGVDVAPMLELLAGNEARPLVPMADRLTDKGSRAVAVLVGTAVLISVGVLVMFMVGSFLH
jgi:hypothetical protein